MNKCCRQVGVEVGVGMVSNLDRDAVGSGNRPQEGGAGKPLGMGWWWWIAQQGVNLRQVQDLRLSSGN